MLKHFSYMHCFYRIRIDIVPLMNPHGGRSTHSLISLIVFFHHTPLIIACVSITKRTPSVASQVIDIVCDERYVMMTCTHKEVKEMLVLSENQRARLREKIESEVLEAMDDVIDDIDVSEYIDSYTIKERIGDYLSKEIENEIDDVLDDVLDELFG